MQNYSEFSKEGQRIIASETGYTHDQLITEDEMLIPEHLFEEYAGQLAEDLGLIENPDQWPATCIDWEWAARELKHDYTSLTIAGVDYLMRAF
jgi:hypothetical protein